MAQIFSLEYPQSLGVYDDYAAAQKAVDHLADHEFPVETVLIVGTDLKQLERVTGRLTWGRVILSGVAGGAWFGLLIGLLLGLFAAEGEWLAAVLTGVLLGVVWGGVIAAVGYAASRGRRDFSSVKTILPSKYEVLVEHKHLARGQELLAQMPGRTTTF
ncbi:general stress protein [Aeromicrobium sp. 179-A 4D2 NHS]|uniref:general stress protein n=1 Tax=Aeromicrobium sp. 179-A 4D2 NHS TaxID=3142375 RepID=UPI0039A005EC